MAREAGGFRWVVWNTSALPSSALEGRGRFLARPDDLLAHFHLPAGPELPESEDSLALVPPYAVDLDEIFPVAERAGLFAAAGAILQGDPEGGWLVRFPGEEGCERGEHLAEVLCRATLRWVRKGSSR